MSQFAAIIIIFLIFAFLLQVDFIFYIVYIFLGIYGWSRWMTPRALKSVEIRREFTDHAFWGEKVPVTVTMRNTSRISVPWLQVRESVAVDLMIRQTANQVLNLRGRETVSFIYAVQARRRGYYKIGPMQLRTSDLFGLFPDHTAVLPAEYMTIYPRIMPLNRLGLPSRLPFGTVSSKQRLFEDPARPMGVREYRSGDSLRQINWKTSAHTRTMMVRTHEPAISLETAVLLNLNLSDYTWHDTQGTVEWAIELAASLAAHLVQERQSVGLITNGIDPLAEGDLAADSHSFDEKSGRLLRQLIRGKTDNQETGTTPVKIPPRPGRAHLMKILEQLARIEADTTTPFTAWAASACSQLTWGVTILAITPQGDEATCHTLHHLVRAGYNSILLVTEPDAEFSKVRDRARRLGFSAFHVTQEKDLDQWQRPLPLAHS
ncbi:MAG: DUF58 domain-containing protein [Anaerolineae bacterium]|nr:DUF58 domain-containing protein [Anaerolineae bacterium]